MHVLVAFMMFNFFIELCTLFSLLVAAKLVPAYTARVYTCTLYTPLKDCDRVFNDVTNLYDNQISL